jgi:glycosyltransferase involved in cell wall biosynthesis
MDARRRWKCASPRPTSNARLIDYQLLIIKLAALLFFKSFLFSVYSNPMSNDTLLSTTDPVDTSAGRGMKYLSMIVVGQTPPPVHGQAIMIQRLLDLKIPGVEMYHVPMRFSGQISDIGRIRLWKLIEGIKIITLIIATRLRTGAQVLYYPPAGPHIRAVLRDVVILVSTRWMFQRIVFHFHAGGVGEFLGRASAILRSLARRAYDSPDLAIETAHGAPRDGAAVRAKRTVVVWCGVEDAAAEFNPRARSRSRRCRILFAGVLREDKGVIDLIDACATLVNQNVDFECQLMGAPPSEQMQARLVARINERGLAGHVRFLGILSGPAKWQAFREADIFCFPTFYASESFGIVAVEAMSFSLPVVATAWRGLADIVTDEVGIIVPIQDPVAISAALSALIHDPERRVKLGEAGRRRYLELFTMENFARKLGDALLSLQVHE